MTDAILDDNTIACPRCAFAASRNFCANCGTDLRPRHPALRVARSVLGPLADYVALFPALVKPRWLVDEPRKRFTGGGISSSLDLALRLVELIAGVETAQSTQLSNQYAPSPPVHAGDPTEASPELVISTTQSQADFTAELRAATLQVIGQS